MAPRPIAAALLTAALPAASGAAQPEDIAPPSCNYGAPAADAPAELAQFDFLIGDYAIHAHAWRDGEWVAAPASWGPARWNGRYVLGGTAIEDEWYDKDPGLDPATGRGINVRQWDPEAGEWDMMWFDDKSRQVFDLRAREIDGVLTMWQVYPDRPDFRAYFERYGADSWARISLVPDDEGGWTKQFKLLATRIPCEP